MSEEKEQFTGEKLKELRKKYGLTQKELADKIGTEQTRISEWETNTKKINKLTSFAFSKLFEELRKKN